MIGRTGNPGRLHQSMLNAQKSRDTSMNRIASGKRINSASDDAVGLAISMAMESQTRSLRMQINNRQDEISLMQTAEGALSSTSDMIHRINELSVQASNSTLSDSDRGVIQFEIDQLKEQINMTANNTSYNTHRILDGSFDTTLENGGRISIGSSTAEALGIADIDVSTLEGAQSAIGSIRGALDHVTSERSSLGAVINSNTSQIASLENELINTISAGSRIADADIAAEIIKMNSSSLQSDAALRVFTMSNESRNNMLSLLSD